MKPTKLLFALAVAALLGGFTQKIEAEELPSMGQFVFKGKIENVNPENPGKVQLAVCDIWNNEVYDIPIQSDGTFTKDIPVREIQDVYLYIGDTFTLPICDGDTITLTMDKNRWEETLNISAQTPERDRELKLAIELYRRMRERELTLTDALRKKSRDLKQSATDSTLMRQFVEYVYDLFHR